MGVLSALHSKAIRAAFAVWYGPTAYGRQAAFLEKSQWWSPEEMSAYQVKKLRSLLGHAYANVPFYRKLFDRAGMKRTDIVNASDLQELPILTKQDIQQHLPQLLSDRKSPGGRFENHSGGSTGQPTKFYQDSKYKAWEQADLLRNYRMTGYELGMRWAFLWGSDYDGRAHNGYLGLLKDRVIYNLVWVNTFDLNRSLLFQTAERLVRWRPLIMVAYVSSAVLLARLVRENNIRGIEPMAIQTSAEVLTQDARHLIESTFGCSVFDRYGCREVGNISHECNAHTGLHVLAENNLVELVDDHGTPVPAGSMGRVVVTNLNNFTMPFIRYDVGDLAVWADRPCPCGRGLPLLQAIQGRMSDIIVSPSGKLLHGEFFSHLFYKLDGVQQYRVIQKSQQDLCIQIVPSPNFQKDKAFAFLSDIIRRHGDPGFTVHFDLRSYLPAAPSGKYRFTISKVPLILERR